MLSWIAGGAVLAALVLTLDRLTNFVARPVPRPPDRTVDELDAVAWERARVPAGDHALPAWILGPPAGTAPHPAVFVLAHGWGASYGTVLRLGEPLAAAGHRVVLFDVRGHGSNEPLPWVTIRHFRDDTHTLLSWARARFPGRPLVLVGHSLGGAGAVLAVAEGAPADALVLVATPADVVQVTGEYLTDQGLPGALVVRLLRPFLWRRVGLPFAALTPVLRIRELRLPLLLLQPEHDQRVTRAHAERLAEAAGRPYVLVRGAEHTDVLEHPETVRRVLALGRSLEDQRASAEDQRPSARGGRE